MAGRFHTDFALAALVMLFAASPAVQDAAHAQQLQAVTERGNVFVLERTGGDGDGDGGVSGLAGFGTASRLIYKEYDGIVIHGTGRTGTVDSMTPYHHVPEHTDFVAAIGSADGTARLAIPEFYLRYDLAQDRLAESDPPGTDTDSILGYSEQRALWGDVAVSSISSRGIEVTGAGRLVLKINGMDGAFDFRGTLAPGAEVRLVESPYDLMALPHDRAAGGFLTSRVTLDPGTDGLHVLAGPAGISEVRATFSYDQQVIRTYWHDWRGVWNVTTVNRVSVSPDLVMGPDPSGYRVISGDRTDPVLTVLSPPVPDYGIIDVSSTVLNFEHAIYDTLPARQLHQWSTSPFDGVLEVGQGTKYLVIDSSGGRSVIGAGAAPEDYDNPLFSIHGLPADTPYEVTTQEGETIVAGMTSPAGVARHVLGGPDQAGGSPRAGGTFTGWFCDPPHFSHDIHECVRIGPGTYAEPRAAAKGHCPDPSLHVLLCHRETFTLAGSGQQDGWAGAFAGEDGHLLLYPQSLTWTGTGSDTRIAFDHLNSEMIPLGRDSAIAAGTAYNAHAYAKIPVTGSDLEIAGTRLDGVAMPYLDGSYSDGDALHVPIIPGYRTIHMEANGLPVSIAVGDLIGDSNLRIADTSSSTVRVTKPSGFTTQIGATAGAVTFVVAGTDGKIKAHLSARVSGESAITNTRELEYVPPPPPPPRPRDPLTTWVEVYVNGAPRQIDGLDRTRIFFSDAPLEDHDGGVTGTSSWHTARFSYPEVNVSDTISVPVDAGDFVEVYFYTKIEAHGSVPPLPGGFAEVSRSSAASATAVLEYATMGTSM